MRAGIVEEVVAEADRATAKFGPMTSSHEGLGVLLEEFDELKAAIHQNDGAAVRHEAIQVSAVALRIASCCGLADFDDRSGFAR